MNTFSLPSALDHIDRIDRDQTVIFLDFDGTLTPIVAHPDDAVLSDSMRAVMDELTHHFPVAVISGRDLEDVQSKIKLHNLYYAGCHGLDISGPRGLKNEVPMAKDLRSLLDEKEEAIQDHLLHFSGAELERKRFSLAIHYRNVEEKQQENFRKEVEKIGEHPKLKWQFGKKILELQPDIDWDKGKAVLWLLNQINFDNPFSIYIGDDLTDEEAFKVIADNGMSIVIADEERETSAKYRLDDSEEVQLFMEKLLKWK